MSERKVLNKYYPPDFDPAKIPKLEKGAKTRQWVQRVMAPFNMRCNTCGEYIARAKKFNMRREKVIGEDYLGLFIFRFYLRCPRCVSEITFKTDLKNCDYEMEHGATRNFMAQTLIKREQEQLKKEKEQEVLDPMTILENRTKDSQKEMAMIDTLEELQELSKKSSKVSHDDVIDMVRAPGEAARQRILEMQEAEDEAVVRSIFGGGSDDVGPSVSGGETPRVKRLEDSSSDDDDDDDWKKTKALLKRKSGNAAGESVAKVGKVGSEAGSNGVAKATFAEPKLNSSSSNPKAKGLQKQSWDRSVGSLGGLKKGGLVVKKTKKTETESSKDIKETAHDIKATAAANDPVTSTVMASAGSDRLLTAPTTAVIPATAVTPASVETPTGTVTPAATSAPISGGLLGLGAYSDSDESD